ncbi:MAG: efflux RND transporter periplasmic adaptor subunit [Rhodanobacter sp.]|jgi:RND family efflux transporter MFP subunit|nr:efflux RND transporter periplasmic adaptor subunit [Rhodanobacter sp.]
MKVSPRGCVAALAPALLAIVLAGCGNDAKPPRAQRPIDDVQTLTVPAAGEGSGRSWDGVVEAVRQTTLSAQTSARVVEVNYDIGDHVTEGAVLLRMTAVEQRAGVDSARAQLRAAEAALVEAENTLRRYTALADKQFVSRLQLDQLRSARDSAAAARNAARAQVTNAGQQTNYTVVRAPFAGIVSARHVEPGESVVFGGNLIAGQTLMTLFSPDALRIDVSVPQADAAAIRAQPQAQLALDDGRTINIEKVMIFPSADPATHSVKVRVPLPRLDPVPIPGTTAKVRFPATKGSAFPRIPTSALIRRGELNAVYVLAQGQLSLRQLRLGEESGTEVEVISGLQPGEAIATDPIAAAQALAKARQGGS